MSRPKKPFQVLRRRVNNSTYVFYVVHGPDSWPALGRRRIHPHAIRRSVTALDRRTALVHDTTLKVILSTAGAKGL
jgi:hypothetical protein